MNRWFINLFYSRRKTATLGSQYLCFQKTNILVVNVYTFLSTVKDVLVKLVGMMSPRRVTKVNNYLDPELV